MENYFFILNLVVVTSIVIGWFIFLMTKDITFYSAKTDNHQIIAAAAEAEKWGWPSGMHRFAGGKAHMKEFAVMALAFIQRILNDKTSDRALVALCLACHTISSILLFVVTKNYWGIDIAVLIFLLFVFSFWPKLVALWGGVVLVAEVNFILSILVLQWAESAATPVAWVGYFVFGLTIGLILFSSASSRKYLILSAGAFFFSLRREIAWPFLSQFHLTSLGIGIVGIIFVILIGLLAARFKLCHSINMLKTGQIPKFLERLVSKKENRSAADYSAIAGKLLNFVTGVSLAGIFYLALNLVVSQRPLYWQAHFCALLGVAAVVFWLTYPNILSNLNGYYIYSQYGKSVWRSRFYAYREYFAAIGKPIKDDMRGAGLWWVIRYFHLMAPVLFWLMLFSAGGVTVLISADGFRLDEILTALAILLLSLSPILIAEITKAVQVGRSYYPGLVGMLLFIGYAFSIFGQKLTGVNSVTAFNAAAVIVLAHAAWNIKVFLADVLPSRMATADLIKELQKRGIRKFFTYDTPYNDSFVNSIPQALKNDFDISYTNNINEAKGRYVVVPATNSRSCLMYDYPLARSENRQFEQDPALNRLIESKEIVRFAVASFKTLGSSRIWVHESEVPSYQDLILGNITSEDLWRGRAWLLKL